MSNWIILSKLIIIMYFIFVYIGENIADSSNMILSLLVLLIYISLNMLIYIVKSIPWRRSFLMASILILVLGNIYLRREFLSYFHIYV
jgi:hypothetical protein